MQSIGPDSLSSLKDAAISTISSISIHVRAGLEQVAPFRRRFAKYIEKNPTLAAGIGRVTGIWTKLVDAFCEMIDPLVLRYFPARRLVAVTTGSGEIELHATGKSGVTPLGLLASIDATKRAELASGKWTAIELRLSPEQLLQRSLSLPAASRDFLGPIIEHKLERLTPWRVERVMYGYQVLPDADSGGGITVMLTATSKDFVAVPRTTLEAAGLMPTAIGSEQDTLSEPLRLNLIRGASTAQTNSRRFVSRGALVILALLTVACTGSSFWASNAADANRVTGIRLAKARRLLKTAAMGAIGDRERILLGSKQPDQAMVVLVDRLAAVIPDDTYLKEFTLTPDKVRLVGVSGNAPALIGKLESIGLINVRIAAAVTREKNQLDSFEITADQAATQRKGVR